MTSSLHGETAERSAQTGGGAPCGPRSRTAAARRCAPGSRWGYVRVWGGAECRGRGIPGDGPARRSAHGSFGADPAAGRPLGPFSSTK